VSPIVQRWIENAREDPEAFWGKAAEQLLWLRKWDQVFEWTPPTFRWSLAGRRIGSVAKNVRNETG